MNMADDNLTIEGLQARVAELEEINATLEGELAKELAKHATTKTKLRVARAPKSDKVRAIGVMKAPKNDDEAAERKAAVDAALADGETHVVFSDGKREIRELAPLVVGGAGWRVTPQGHVLDDEPLLEPGDMIRDSVELHGFGLVDADGRQIAYQQLPQPIMIGRNMRVQLPHNTIRF
jgi:hypothetical protein